MLRQKFPLPEEKIPSKLIEKILQPPFQKGTPISEPPPFQKSFLEVPKKIPQAGPFFLGEKPLL